MKASNDSRHCTSNVLSQPHRQLDTVSGLWAQNARVKGSQKLLQLEKSEAQDCSNERTSQASSPRDADSQPLKINPLSAHTESDCVVTHCTRVASSTGQGPVSRSSQTQAHCWALPRPHAVLPSMTSHNCKHSSDARHEKGSGLGKLPEPAVPPCPAPPPAPEELAMAPPPEPIIVEPAEPKEVAQVVPAAASSSAWAPP